MLVRAAGCGSISGFIIQLLELHMEEHREDIASLLLSLIHISWLFIVRNGEEVPEGFAGQVLKGDAKRIVAMSSTQRLWEREPETAYIDGRLHRRIAMLVRAAGCGSISGFIRCV